MASRGFGGGVLVLILIASSAAAQQPSDDELEKQIRADVAAASAEAATHFDQGNVAREAGRFDEAAAAYQKAIELAPKVDHAHRRLCSAYQAMEKLDDA